MDSTSLFLGLLFGCIGMGFFMYGKKQQRPPALIYGVALMGLPYVVPGVAPMIGITAGLSVVFWLAMRRGL